MKTALRTASPLNGLVLQTQNRSNFPLAAVSRNVLLITTIQKCSSAALDLPWQERAASPRTKRKKSYGTLSVWREVIVNGFKPDQWVVEQVWVSNPNDGVKVPMFIVRNKALVKTGESFCFLYG